MMHIASSVLLAALAVPAAVCSTEPTHSPSVGLDMSTTPIATLPSAAVHSKMSSSLRLEMNTPGPSPASSAVPSSAEVVSPTTAPSTAPSTDQPVSTATPAVSLALSDTGVRCEAVDDSTSYRTIELPFYFEVETSWKSGVVDTLQSVEQALLKTIADSVLACNSGGEEIRRLLNEAEQSKAVAAYVVSDDTSEYACPSNLIAMSCHLVEIKLAVVLSCGDDEDGGDDAMMSEIYDLVGRAILTLNDEGEKGVAYVGNDPLALASENKLISQRAGLIEESDNLSLLVFVLFVCGIAATCIVMVTLVRKARGTKKQGAGVGDVESPSASVDAEPRNANQNDKPMDWPALVYLESLRLSWSAASDRTVTEDYGLP